MEPDSTAIVPDRSATTDPNDFCTSRSSSTTCELVTVAPFSSLSVARDVDGDARC
ncbi:hypothetical protein ACFPRL_19185 [Pseudoclavibacter helvolus]